MPLVPLLIFVALLGQNLSPRLSAQNPTDHGPTQDGGVMTLKLFGDQWLVEGELQTPQGTIQGHLRLELHTPQALLLHTQTLTELSGNAQQRFRWVSDNCVLNGLPAQLAAARPLEKFNLRFSPQLGNHPLLGSLGLGALKGFRIKLDGVSSELQLLPARRGEDEAEGNVAGITTAITLPFEEHEGRLWLSVTAQRTHTGAFLLSSENADTRVAGPLCAELGSPAGDLKPLLLGSFDISERVATRPEELNFDHPDGAIAVSGTQLLRQLRLDIDFVNQSLRITPLTAANYPHEEFAAFDALRQGQPAPLEAFLIAHPNTRLAADAAAALWHLRQSETSPSAAALSVAAHHFLRTRSVREHRDALLYLLDELENLGKSGVALQLGVEQLPQLRQASNSGDHDPLAIHHLQHRLGRLHLEQGQLKEAYRQLLSAAFGLGHVAELHLDLGRLYEARGQFTRAASRFTLALTGTTTATRARHGLERVQKHLDNGEGVSTSTLERLLAGRFPHFATARRYRGEAQGRVVCELFTSVHNPQSVAVELALQGVRQYYGSDKVSVMSYHLPLPRADALMNGVGLLRARRYPIRDLPTCIIGGSKVFTEGGGAADADAVFNQLCQIIDAQLATQQADPQLLQDSKNCQLRGVAHYATAACRHLQGNIEINTKVAGDLQVILLERIVLHPGENQLPFHYSVARAFLTPEGKPLRLEAGQHDIPLTLELGEISRQLRRLLDEFEKAQGASFKLYPTTLDPRELSVIAFVESIADDPRSAATPSSPAASSPQQIYGAVEIPVDLSILPEQRQGAPK